MKLSYDIYDDNNDSSNTSKILVHAQVHNSQSELAETKTLDIDMEPLMLNSRDGPIITLSSSPEIPVNKKTLKNRKRKLRRKQKKLQNKLKTHAATPKSCNMNVAAPPKINAQKSEDKTSIINNDNELEGVITETIIESYKEAIDQLVRSHFITQKDHNVPAFIEEQNIIKNSFMRTIQSLLKTEIGTKVINDNTVDNKNKKKSLML